MTMSAIRPSIRLLFPLSLAFAVLMGCSTVETKRPNEPAAPQSAPVQPITDLSPALRCMDTLLQDYGAHDISVLVEDMTDQTKGAGANTKDLLTSVLTDMTQRSRAIRVFSAGKDLDSQPVKPQFALRGTVSQLDNQNVRHDGADTLASVLGLDLTLLATQDMSVVPGTASRNSIVLFRQGKGYDGKAEVRKFGVTFGIAASSTDVVGQASRTLVSLASIELFGRMTRVPYWTCLGLTEAHQGVAAEMQDWYDTMAAQPADIIKYFQGQLRLRHVYDGPVDGVVNAPFKDAVARYREALGQAREAKLSLDFFKAYLAADHRQIESKLAPSAPANGRVEVATIGALPAAPTVSALPAPAPAATAAGPLVLRIGSANDARRFASGERVTLTIRPSRDAHVYCFLQDEDRKIRRFFPNRFQRDSRVLPGQGLTLPNERFEITMNALGRQETVSCFATDRDVLAQLPNGVNAADFDPLPVASFDQVRSAFTKVANGAVAQDTFQIQPK